ncbi:alpha/beta hydrolase-fold protein [Nocardioides phosphati]|uniref:alpha/beta hydrolase-fold protein n=1 Tax=Nocardioides phosphati TaxID=1867775 RepID=UPI0016656997|nr:alpha/beta hydrolase-fold protein [Nocardioides phosphati]
MGLTRRGLLLGGMAGAAVVAGAGALVEGAVVPGADSDGGDLSRGVLRGAEWWISRPDGASGRLPVVVALHGAYAGAEQWRRKLDLDDAHRASGARFALAAIDGGVHDYWHPRAVGRDPRSLVLDRFLPLLAREGLDVARPAFLGWSMGGYGALMLATEIDHAGPVVATSPALWSRFEDSAPGAYDGPTDFARWGILGNHARIDRLARDRVRVDCGASDPFVPGVTELRRELPSAKVRFSPGAHNAGYWKRVLPAQLAWLDARV